MGTCDGANEDEVTYGDGVAEEEEICPWLVEQYDPFTNHAFPTPWLYSEAEAREKANLMNIGELNYCFFARPATAGEVSQIESLIATSDAFQKRHFADNP